MEIPAFLRNPVILLSAVAGLIAATWFVLGLPTYLPSSPLGVNEKLDCVSYSPFRAGEGPGSAITIAPERIDADLAKLAPLASCVRTYSTGYGLDRVPALAQKRGMSVILGLAIGHNQNENKKEVERALAVVNANRSTIRAIVVGNEVLSGRELSPAELAVIIRNVRQGARLPVTYADNAETWLKSSDIVGIVEQITVNFSPYAAQHPVALGSIQQQLRETRVKFAAVFPGKEVVFAEAGWPSEGRMRGGARPSRINQALAVHEMLAAAKAGNFRIHPYEAFDQPWRMRSEGTAGSNMGLFEGDTREPKFLLGGPVRNFPYWFFQIVIGLMNALVIFAAGFLGARIAGPVEPGNVNWLPVSVIALIGGLMTGKVLIDAALQNQSFLDWVYSALLVLLAVVVPPVCASALIRRVPFVGLAALFDPLSRNLTDPLSRIVALLLVLTMLAGIETAFGLVFDAENRSIQFAPLTAPIFALLTVAFVNPAGERRETIAETAAATVIAVSALFIFFSEGAVNWQALWFEALLLVLAWVLLQARGARTR